MERIIESIEKLKVKYDKKSLLKVVKDYRKILNDKDIKPIIYYESVGALIDKHEDGEIEIDDLLDECIFIFKEFDYLFGKMREDKLKLKLREQAYNMLISPLLMLQVVFILKQDYKTLGGFIGRKRNKMFDDAMGGMK